MAPTPRIARYLVAAIAILASACTETPNVDGAARSAVSPTATSTSASATPEVRATPAAPTATVGSAPVAPTSAVPTAPAGGATVTASSIEAVARDQLRGKGDAALARAYLVATTEPRPTFELEALNRLVELRIVGSDILIRLLVSGDASDAALAAAGLRVSSRIGAIVSGEISAQRLPDLAALPDVTRFEASLRLSR